MYVALTYVDTGKRIYAPGEIVENDPNAEWHLKINAIRHMAEEPAPAQPEEAPEEMPEEAPEEAEAPDEEDDTEAEEAFEEPEAPEIDVTAALVQEPEKPKARNTRKGGKGK